MSLLPRQFSVYIPPVHNYVVTDIFAQPPVSPAPPRPAPATCTIKKGRKKVLIGEIKRVKKRKVEFDRPGERSPE